MRNMRRAAQLKARNDEPGMWVAQVYGNFEFLLQPVEVCRKICHNLRFNLTQGQICKYSLNLPACLWNFTVCLCVFCIMRCINQNN